MHRYLFHLVGSRWSLERNLAWGDEQPASRLLLVGRSDSLDQPCLSMMIARCLARPDYVRA